MSTERPRLYLGLDAGGTKTFCLIGSETGEVLGFGRGGPGNYEVAGVPAADNEIRRAIDAALAEAGCTLDDLSGAGLGIAGADLPQDYTMLERELFTPLFGALPRVFRNDSMAGLRGGIRSPYGIVIACGTGCVCAGRNRAGEETRVGGLSEDLGDAVSGESIGMEGLRAVWRARDGVVPPTLLTERFVARAAVADVEALFQGYYDGAITFADLQPAAKIVFIAAHEGDAAACDILEWGGRYLGRMVNACARRLNMQQDAFEVVTAGSVFKGSSPVLVDAMRTVIHRECPRATAVMPEFEPVVGALLLGLELAGPVGGDTYTTLAPALDRMAAAHGVSFRSETAAQAAGE